MRHHLRRLPHKPDPDAIVGRTPASSLHAALALLIKRPQSAIDRVCTATAQPLVTGRWHLHALLAACAPCHMLQQVRMQLHTETVGQHAERGRSLPMPLRRRPLVTVPVCSRACHVVYKRTSAARQNIRAHRLRFAPGTASGKLSVWRPKTLPGRPWSRGPAARPLYRALWPPPACATGCCAPFLVTAQLA